MITIHRRSFSYYPLFRQLGARYREPSGYTLWVVSEDRRRLDSFLLKSNARSYVRRLSTQRATQVVPL